MVGSCGVVASSVARHQKVASLSMYLLMAVSALVKGQHRLQQWDAGTRPMDP